MYTVSELSRAGAVSPHVVRYYTRIRLLEPARDPNNGYKLFSATDAARLGFIRQAKQLGYSLGDIRRLLELQRRGRSPCAEARAILARRLAQTRRHLAELAARERRMAQALALWQALPDQPAQSDHWCRLIEAAMGELGASEAFEPSSQAAATSPETLYS